ncbi:hypothetical protein GCM10023093_11300 [Nemorincola caseinilytica]|uniref:Uncharacterized protein n=1 Tax=Nemorincola caseinilytica TaxID=2054315 RepID=A0ABP8NCD5_9BACT
MKRFLTTMALAAASYGAAHAQAGSFCEAVNAIMKDAPNDFKNIMGRQMQANMNASMWASSIKIPGTIGYRIVQAMGLFYEGALIQTPDKDKLPPVYEEYKKKLSDCLTPLGYKMTLQENVVAGLGDLKKVVFMKDVEEYKEGANIKDLPPHITMEATYNKEGGFTIVIFIFQH